MNNHSKYFFSFLIIILLIAAISGTMRAKMDNDRTEWCESQGGIEFHAKNGSMCIKKEVVIKIY